MSLILIVFRDKKKDDFPQDIFDNIFLNIEYHIRELGYGDVAVNKKMKSLLRNFYDILLKIRPYENKRYIINMPETLPSMIHQNLSEHIQTNLYCIKSWIEKKHPRTTNYLK